MLKEVHHDMALLLISDLTLDRDMTVVIKKEGDKKDVQLLLSSHQNIYVKRMKMKERTLKRKLTPRRNTTFY